MTMDKEAVEHIQQTAHIPEVIKAVGEHNTQIPVVAIPQNMSVESMEKYMPNASRMRLSYETTSIADFIAYNEDNDTKGATCFVNAERMSAKTVFDLGTKEEPGHQQHSGSLALTKTAAFKALLNINGSKIHQKQAGEFIEDWADDIITFTKAGDAMTPTQAARSLQDLTIETAKELNSKVDDFGASMSAMERIEAKNQHIIPAQIEFKLEPYNGLKERSFKLRVSILTGGGEPLIVFRVLKLESLEEDIAEEFKDKIAHASKDLELTTYIGNI